MPADFKTSKVNQATHSHQFMRKKKMISTTAMWLNGKHSHFIYHIIMQNEK